MSRWILPSEDRIEWSALLSSFQVSSFRLEAQQIYSNPVEDARLADFLAGRPITVTFEKRLKRARERLAAGATKTTVRVVVEPPTNYTRLELACYPVLAAGGEDIRVVVVRDGAWPDELPRHDFFLFDDHDVWRMHYNDDHTFAGAEQLGGGDELARHRQWRDAAIALAIPLHDYPHVEPLPS